MAMPSNLDSQIAYGLETTPGTRQAPSRRVEHVSFTPNPDRQIIVGKGIQAGRRTARRHYLGADKNRFTAAHELSAASCDLLLRQIMGAVSTAGSNPYTHTLTCGPLVVTDALTVEAAIPNEAGTQDVYSFLGAQIMSGKISCKVGELAMIDYTAAAMSFDPINTRSVSTATYSSAHDPISWVEASLEIDSVEVPLTGFEFSFDLGLAVDRHRMQATNPANALTALESGFRKFGLKLDSDYLTDDHVNLFLDGTEAAVVLVIGTSASNRITITTNAYFEKPTGPAVSGPGLSTLSQSAVMHSLTSDDTALSIDVENANSTIS